MKTKHTQPKPEQAEHRPGHRPRLSLMDIQHKLGLFRRVRPIPATAKRPKPNRKPLGYL